MEARALRGHWDTENRLPWGLDMAFRKDESGIRTGHTTHNLADPASLGPQPLPPQVPWPRVPGHGQVQRLPATANDSAISITRSATGAKKTCLSLTISPSPT